MYRSNLGTLLPAALSVGMLVWACGGGSSSPTEVSIQPGAGTANLSGSVTVGAQPVTVGVPEAATAGVTVRVQGTNLATTTDTTGQFLLAGVPHGTQVVVFESAAAAAPLPIEGIQPGEQIEVSVTLRGSSVTVDHMTRSGDAGSGPGPEDDANENSITLEIQPQSWNLEWEHSSGTVSALLRGSGFDRIELDSIVLVGTSGTELAPQRVDRQGNHVRARFGKADALATLDDPETGEGHEILVRFTVDGDPQELSFTIRIVGDDTEDDEGEDDAEPVSLALEIQPRSWNTNWSRSNGTVSAKIQGSGFDRVDLDSVVLIGSSGDLVDPRDVSRQGNHVRARFGKADAIASLADPAPGEVHTVTVQLTVQGVPESLTYDIQVTGPE